MSEYKKREISELTDNLDQARKSDPTKYDEQGRWLRLYSEREYSLYLLEKEARKYNPRKLQRLAFNVIRSAIDGLTAQLCETPINVSYMTEGADWSLRKKARMKNTTIRNEFRRSKMVTMIPRVVKHAAISGRGHIHVMRVFDRVVLEVAPYWEVIVNHLTCLSGDPIQKFRTRRMMPRVLAKRFPDHADVLMKNPDDPLEFVDEWTLPSGPDTGDGCWSQFIPGLVVLDQGEYKHERFPLVDFMIDDSPVAYGGSGIPEQAEGIQLEIMSVLETIQNNVYHGGNLKVAVQSGSNSTLAQTLSTELGCPVIEYTGDKPPTFMTADMGLSQLLGYLELLERKAFELTGISQMNVQSQTPFASMSGKARLINNQTVSKRFATHHQRLEQFHIDVATAYFDVAQDIVSDGKSYKLSFAGRIPGEEITLKDVAGNDDMFDVMPWSVAMAGEGPSAQVSYVDQYMSLGMMDLESALAMSDMPPDAHEYIRTQLAPKDLAESMVNRIIEDGEYLFPNPLMDLEYAATLSMLWYNRGMLANRKGDLDDKLNLLADFHDNCRALQPPPMPVAPEQGVSPEQSVALIQNGAPPV